MSEQPTEHGDTAVGLISCAHVHDMPKLRQSSIQPVRNDMYLLNTRVGTRWPDIITFAGRVAGAAATGGLTVSFASHKVSRALAEGLLLSAGVTLVWLTVSAGAGSQQGSGPCNRVSVQGG